MSQPTAAPAQDEPLRDDGNCFACGQENPHGLQMNVEFLEDEQAAQCRITLPQHFQGWSTMAHGGVVGTLLDEVMAYAVLHFVGPGVTAIQENRYRAPVPLHKDLEVKGWITKARGKLVLTQAWVRETGQEAPLAEANAKFFLLKKPEKAE